MLQDGQFQYKDRLPYHAGSFTSVPLIRKNRPYVHCFLNAAQKIFIWIRPVGRAVIRSLDQLYYFVYFTTAVSVQINGTNYSFK